MDKQMAIKRLKHLASLKKEQNELWQFVYKDYKQQVQTALDSASSKAILKRPKAPKVRDTYVDLDKFKTENSGSKAGSYVTLLVIAAVIGLIFIPMTLGWITYFVLLAIGAMVVYWLKKASKAGEAKNQEQEKDRYQRLLQPFHLAMEDYEEEVKKGLLQLPEYEEACRQAFVEGLQIIKELENKKVSAQKRLDKCGEELTKIDFIPIEYYDFAENIIQVLETGLANTYEEALSMVIEQEEQRQEVAFAKAKERARIKTAITYVERQLNGSTIYAPLDAENNPNAVTYIKRSLQGSTIYAPMDSSSNSRAITYIKRQHQGSYIYAPIDLADNASAVTYIERQLEGSTIYAPLNAEDHPGAVTYIKRRNGESTIYAPMDK